MFLLSPAIKIKLKRFKEIKRGYLSFIIIMIILILSMFAEIFVNSRALLVKYDGAIYFPVYSKMRPGTFFGLDYEYETNYRELKNKFKTVNNGNFVILPPIPYNAYENSLIDGEYPPYKPSLNNRHFLGTDNTGRDVAARLIYGFRIAIFFSLALSFFNFFIGVIIGLFMGYYGGKFDLFFQRIIEIWSNMPFIYIVIIISSLIIPNFISLLLIMIIFGWISITWYIRTITYREKERKYIMAAKALGASNKRIIFYYIFPNTISLVITFLPFSISSGITALTSLDYLGFGLPAPTPSWGELLRQGTDNISAYWLAGSVVLFMIIILVMITFVGEAIREAFDPKKYNYYR